jgi:serine/threonine protein kinase
MAVKSKKLKLEVPSIGTTPTGSFLLPSFVQKGDPLDKCIKVEETGWGAFGFVDKVKYRDGTFKAIKVVNAGPRETLKILKALNEGQIGMKMKHPHILSIDEIWYDGTRFFFVMDLIEPLTVSIPEPDLPKSLEDQKEKLVLFQQLVSAVEHLVSKGFLHRDIKVQNTGVRRGKDGEPHLVIFDFGEACEILENYSDCPGTAIHMAPEVLNSSQYSDKSEIWALMSFLIEILTGKPMILHSFSGALGSVSTICVQLKIDDFRKKNEPPIPEVFKTDKSPAGILLLQILQRGLAIDPAERLTFPQLEALLQELIDLL